MDEDDSVKSKLGKIINISSWVAMIISFLLAAVVALTQTSVPGDLTYGVKIGFEKTILAGYRVFGFDSRYQIDLTELRFAETKKILKSKNAFLGLDNLFKQVIETELAIYNIKDPVKRADTARQYIAKLTDINYQLEQEKQGTTTTNNQTNPTARPTVPVVINSEGRGSMDPSRVTQQENISNQISQTQQQISDIITRLDTISNEMAGSGQNITPSPTPIPPIENPALMAPAIAISITPTSEPTVALSPTPYSSPTPNPDAANLK